MKFIERARRRRAGIYLVRTRTHRAAMKGPLWRAWPFGERENGYVGRSNYVDLRRHCHLGACRHRQHTMKDWADLDPVWWVLRLPWWLSWKWVQATLEALAIWALLPRYNVQLNTKNPRRVPPRIQRIQRAARDGSRRFSPRSGGLSMGIKR